MNSTELPGTDNPSSSTPGPTLEGSSQGSGGLTGETILAKAPVFITQGINPPISLVCFIFTLVNVITFSKMDLRQGVTQNLLILSCSDSLFGAIGVSDSLLSVLTGLGVISSASRPVYMSFWILRSNANLPLNVSFLLTTIIAVVRCCSIMFPLSFKAIFTARRQLVAIVVSCATVSVYMLFVTQTLLAIRFNPENNGTQFLLTQKWKDLYTAMDIFRNILFFTCLTIILVSMVFLITALKRSSRFQLQATGTKSADSSKSSSKMASAVMREARVIKTVILILAIFVACNSPFIFLSIARLAFPEFSPRGKLRLWRRLVDVLASTSLQLNIGLNTVVFYNYNTQFRQIVREMIIPHKARGNKTSKRVAA